MNGIDKITGRIDSDAQKEIDALIAKATAEAEEIAAASRAKAAEVTEQLAAKGKRDALQQEERIASVAQLDARKTILAAKQEVLDEAFEKAQEKLCAMEDAAYIDLLSSLLVKACKSGREQVAFNQKDRTRVGKDAVTKANELLTKKNGSASLTLAEDSRNIKGGFILVDGKVETNCAFETLVRLEKSSMAGEVAKVLFN